MSLSAAAIVDVTARKSDKVLAGPWKMDLTGEMQRQVFDSSGWPRGEYWIRIRVERNGGAVGPYLIRKVWKEILPQEKMPAVPHRIGLHEQSLTSSKGFSSVSGVRFVADPLQKQPDRPLVTMDKPWETELLYYKSLHYEKGPDEFVLEYELAGGDKQRAAERAELASTMCRAVSKDGLIWTKPSLGLVEYKGLTNNNLVPRGQEDGAAALEEAHCVAFARSGQSQVSLLLPATAKSICRTCL